MHLILLVFHQQISVLPPLLARGDATYLLLHGHVEEYLLLLIKFALLCVVGCILRFIELSQMALGHRIDRIWGCVQVACWRVQPPVVALEVFVLSTLYSLSCLGSLGLATT